MKYGYSKVVAGPFDTVVQKTREALSAQGFGIITEIDVKATMKKKLDAEYDNYLILGACNPSFADKALHIEKEVGLLLPCNVIIYEDNGVHISAILPTAAMSMIENEALIPLAQEVEEKLKLAIDAV
jgi:uncharacterized protein (DUF302 family)